MRMYRNLKLRNKLIVAFALVLLLTATLGVQSIFAMRNMQRMDRELYENHTLSISYLMSLSYTVSSQHVNALRVTHYHDIDPELARRMRTALTEDRANFLALLEEYHATILEDDVEELALYEQLHETYLYDFVAAKDELLSAIDSTTPARISNAEKALYEARQLLSGIINDAIDNNNLNAADKVASNYALSEGYMVVTAALLVFILLLSIFFIMVISNIISKPMEGVMKSSQQVATTGSLSFSGKIIGDIQKYAQYHDESGTTSEAFGQMMENIIVQAKALEQVAAGDLTVNVRKLGPEDTLGNSIDAMILNLNNMFSRINAATEQVNTGASQISDGAQELSQGATEQASAVEELSASMSGVLTQTQANAQNASMAMDVVNDGVTFVNQAVEFMRQMQSAMDGISASSEEIASITKVIDEIALQTNILALNAAVEAARVGQQGRGFAVIAEEIRTLSSKSAKAAKEAAALIQKSLSHVNLGENIVLKTGETINGLSVVSRKLHDTFIEVNTSSKEQAKTIAQINSGIEQISRVVQTNSATAEQSAASSEELSAQAQMLKRLLTRFRLRSIDEYDQLTAYETAEQPVMADPIERYSEH